MFLKKITLTNFRQFYGEQELLISGDTGKNVTLIHAENGVGKTTILNAILWCFYKDTTERFEKPEKIANNQAVSENIYDVKVEVVFEHEGKDYLVSRQANERTEEDVFKAFLVEKGNYKSLDAASAFVDSVVPREMARYFFFDGEYAETFSSQGNKGKVREALEDMLGCRTANQAIKDLNSLQSEIEKQIAALTKNNQSAVFQEKIDALESQNEKDNAERIVLENNLDAAKAARDDITEKLRGAAGASVIQKRRDSLEAERKTLLTQRAKREAELTAWINEGGLGLISKGLADKTSAILEDAKAKGKIPSYIAETFVNDLLEHLNCICKRAFEVDSPEARAIKELLQDAGTATATDRLMNARSLMVLLSDKRQKALPELTRIKQEIEDFTSSVASVESKIEDCRAQLKGSDIKEIAERETTLEKRHQEIEEIGGKITRLKFACEERAVAIDENKKKRDKMLLTNERASSLQHRVALLKKTAQRIEEELIKYREDSRKAIAIDVNEILEKTARRAYYAVIDEKFNLDMFYQDSNTSVARGGGENQMLSLAFIASLIKFGANRMKSTSEVLKPGTSAPLVLDSPFGQLDPTYQKATAQFLPALARQVVLLVSKSQGNPEVIGALGDKIGREYILISENKGPQGDKPSDMITIKGQEIACSRYDCEKTLTRIVSI